MTRRRPSNNQRRRAFTLLELLVVISIIAILIGLLIGAGVAVTRNGKRNATKGALEALNRALDEYIIANGNNIPPFNALDYACTPGGDGPNGDTNTSAYVSNGYMPQRPDASVFIRQARGIGDVDAILGAIPDRFLIVTAAPRTATPIPECQGNEFDTAPSVVDAWSDSDWPGIVGDPTDSAVIERAWPIRKQSLIYYVHPNNRRDRSDPALDQFPDAQELYGSTVNARPYFFSAGPDGFYGHPDEIPQIAAFYGIDITGANPNDAKNLALKKAREDNLYSAPVNIDFRVADGVLNATWPTNPTP